MMHEHVINAMDGQIANASTAGLSVKEFRMRGSDWAAVAAYLQGHPHLASEVPGGKRFKGIPIEVTELGFGFLVAEMTDGSVAEF